MAQNILNQMVLHSLHMPSIQNLKIKKKGETSRHGTIQIYTIQCWSPTSTSSDTSSTILATSSHTNNHSTIHILNYINVSNENSFSNTYHGTYTRTLIYSLNQYKAYEDLCTSLLTSKRENSFYNQPIWNKTKLIIWYFSATAFNLCSIILTKV